MTGLTITQEVLEVVIQPATGPQLVLSVPAAPQIVIAPVGAQGPQGPSAETITVPAMGAISALRVVARGLSGVELVSPGDATQLARAVGITVNAAAERYAKRITNCCRIARTARELLRDFLRDSVAP